MHTCVRHSVTAYCLRSILELKSRMSGGKDSSHSILVWLPPFTKCTGGTPPKKALRATDRVANHNLSYCVTVVSPLFTSGQEDCRPLWEPSTAYSGPREGLPWAPLTWTRHLIRNPLGTGSTFIGTGIPRECRTDGKPSLAAWLMNPFYRL